MEGKPRSPLVGSSPQCGDQNQNVGIVCGLPSMIHMC